MKQNRTSASRLFVTLLLAFVVTQEARSRETAGAAEPLWKATIRDLSYPRRLENEDGFILIHAPQIHAWTDFKHIEGTAAAEAHPADSDEVIYATVTFEADALPDVDRRIVTVSNLEVVAIEFADGRGSEVRHYEMLQAALPEATRETPLDLVLSHLADEMLPTDTPGLAAEAPEVIVEQGPARLLITDGEPLFVPIRNSGLMFVANTNWTLFQDASRLYWLLDAAGWLTAPELEGPWSWAGVLPDDLHNLSAERFPRAAAAAAAEDAPTDAEVPHIAVRTAPAELVVLDGPPALETVGSGELSWVTNTDAPLFRAGADWYLLASGRWFRSDELTGARWAPVEMLPDTFAKIPRDHPRSAVLAAVPGTRESRTAALEAMLPRRTRVERGAEPGIDVSWSGEPAFKAIDATDVERGINTPYDVLRVGARYYLCFEGIWYESDAATGPWRATARIPEAIYEIPASSPIHHTTYAQVEDANDTTITYTTTAGYQSVYIYHGVPVWGTGYYYAPWVYYDPYHPWYPGFPIFYPYPYSYGSASWYNPRTGHYGSWTRYYGPYGGYGYGSSYDPSTGRYSTAESTWDGDEWALSGRSYNPRTGRGVETRRYYDADDNAWKIDTAIEGRAGRAEIERRYDDGIGRTTLESSRGGGGEVVRDYRGDGMTSHGEFVTSDGRTVLSDGRFEDGEGAVDFRGSGGGTGSIERSVGPDGTVTREGAFTSGDQTITTETVRGDAGRRTDFETSGGATGTIAGRGFDRALLAEAPSGDLYAGSAGEVYRRTDEGWAKRENGAWQPVERVSREQGVRRDDLASGMERARASNRERNRRLDALDQSYRARRQGLQGYGNRARQFRGGGRLRRR